MHMEYRVKLSDYNCVIAPNHKLISSVYAGIVKNDNGFEDRGSVSYSRTAYITRHIQNVSVLNFCRLQKIFI